MNTELDSLGLLAGTLGPGSRVFHTGIVVPDLETARHDLGRRLEVPFTDIASGPLDCQTPDGPLSVDLRFCYSTRGAHVELIQAVPGTVWDLARPPGGLHLGVWSDDPTAEADDLDAAGWTREVWATDDAGDMLFSYHRTPYRLLLEVVNSNLRGLYPAWFRTVDSSVGPRPVA